MNQFQVELDRAIEQLEGMESFPILSRKWEHQSVSLASVDGNPFRLDYRGNHNGDFTYWLFSGRYIDTKTFWRDFNGNALEWTVKWLRTLRHESEVMERFGFTQTSFAFYMIEDVRVFRDMDAFSPIIRIVNGTYNCFRKRMTMEETVTEFMRTRSDVQLMSMLTPEARDLVVGGVA